MKNNKMIKSTVVALILTSLAAPAYAQRSGTKAGSEVKSKGTTRENERDTERNSFKVNLFGVITDVSLEGVSAAKETTMKGIAAAMGTATRKQRLTDTPIEPSLLNEHGIDPARDLGVIAEGIIDLNAGNNIIYGLNKGNRVLSVALLGALKVLGETSKELAAKKDQDRINELQDTKEVIVTLSQTVGQKASESPLMQGKNGQKLTDAEIAEKQVNIVKFISTLKKSGLSAALKELAEKFPGKTESELLELLKRLCREGKIV